MKIAYTGAHGTGKTTSVFGLAHAKKIECPNDTIGIFHENARNCPRQINLQGDKFSQLWIFANQMVNEIEWCCKVSILICDRTIFDSIAYARYLGQRNNDNDILRLADKKFELGKEFIDTYDMIIFKTIKKNNYLKDDGCRVTDDTIYRQGIEDNLFKIYEDLGITNNQEKFRVV